MRYEFTGGRDDSRLVIRESAVEPGSAVIEATIGAHLPPHEVPKAARALYEAAGLDVPDLPDIPDPALVQRLADDLRDAMAVDPGMSYPPVTGTYAEALARSARDLLAKGWGRTS